MKVLIVEDDKASRDNLRDMVESQGHQSQVAEDGALGLERFASFGPDLAFVDIQMPKMNGLELLRAIRNDDHDTIVVMNTAFGSEERAIEALRLKANNYLSKPIRLAELKVLLKKYGAIVENRTKEHDVQGLFVRRTFTLKVGNRLDLVAQVADRLLLESVDAIDPKERLGVRMGLAELILNAMEHGNLGITREEKTAAHSDNGPGDIAALCEERLSNPSIASRFVTITFQMDDAGCEWVISDEGEGFDWNAVPNPTEAEETPISMGKGIFLSRFQFDEMEYLGAGNSVRVSKKRGTHDESQI